MSDAGFTFASRFLLATADAAGVPRSVLTRRVRILFQRLARRSKPTIVLEIGAFEASFSRWARESLPDARVVAFEANPYVYERYHDEVSATGVDYVHAAIGPTSGPVRLNVPVDRNGTDRDRVNQIASLTTHHRTENYEVVEIDGLRLDDAIPTTDDDTIVAWIDVEGALEAVLSGSRETLKRAAAVYVEVEHTPMAPDQWLDVDVAAWFAEIGMVPILRDYQKRHQYNLLLISEEMALKPHVAKLAASVYGPRVGHQRGRRPQAASPSSPSLTSRGRRLLRRLRDRTRGGSTR